MKRRPLELMRSREAERLNRLRSGLGRLGSGHGKVDIALQRLSHLSQLGVLILAVVGYFYVVLPTYQLSKLNEDILQKDKMLSERDVQLKEIESRLAIATKNSEEKSRELTGRLVNLEGQVQNKEHELALKTKELQGRIDELAEVRASLALATDQITKREAELRALEKLQEAQYREAIVRLANDVRTTGAVICPISEGPDDGFVNCLRTKVLSRSMFGILKRGDRVQFQNAAGALQSASVKAVGRLKMYSEKKRNDIVSGSVLLEFICLSAKNASSAEATITPKDGEPQKLDTKGFHKICQSARDYQALIQSAIRTEAERLSRELLDSTFAEFGTTSP